ncbi:hypothetical protein CROQUDRAFT_355645 [Cronartium quercuum f. sp. fusiforme G11]|uniref:Uncharacterized protein n=1 Tax=Cronartium quercuum f. sp. fusiforme G11 TaxID=708437 RepID=A0A9P6NAM1_9BASI|nr:hypothetical protein CROQUDRAFT_355645 [Cronartium quercuum f. sp. fusiforme G11]
MSSHPLTSSLSLPAPTVAEWESVRSFGLDNLSPNVSPSRKYRFNGLAGCMVLMTVLYSINLFEALIKKRLWLFKTDKAGYWHPNLQTLIPLLSCIMSMLLFSSIMLQNSDYNKYLRTSTMITQLLAYHFLYFCAVTHTWKILAVLPSTPFHLRTGDGHQTPPISPRAFNAFVCTLYLTFSVVFLPLQIWMARTAATAGAMWFQIMPTLDDLIQNKQQMNATELQNLSQFAIRGLEKLMTPMARSFLLWRVVCGIYTLYITVQLIVYVYASIKLMTTLAKQLKVIRYAAIHAAQLANITISATIGLPEFSPPRKPERIRSRTRKSLHLFWMWVISDEDFSSRVWNDSIVNGVMDEVRHLEEKHKVVNRSRNMIAFHLMIVGAVIASYWVLAACLTIDVFGAGTRTPAIEIVLITQEWGDWAWGIPGLLLSIVSS